MGAEPSLANRRLAILHAIVEEYIAHGEPVASRDISRRWSQTLSAASIRNVMADLADEGYLSQPHTSAGRVPTGKAFYSYTQTIQGKKLPLQDLSRLRSEIGQAGSMEQRMERSSQILTKMTHGLAIAAAIPASAQTLDQIELVALADRRVLVIVVTKDRMVRNRVVTLDDSLSQDDLNSIRNYINRNFSGWVLSEARAELYRRLEQEHAAFDEILGKLNVLCAKGMFEIEVAPEVHMEGASNLVGLDLHLTRERMRELFHALEEKKRILDLLDRFLEQPTGEVAVQIGLAEAHPAMDQLSLIGMSVLLTGGLSAKIAVIGPMRMNYEKAMSAVMQVGRAFQAIPR